MRALTEGQKVYLRSLMENRKIYRADELTAEEWENLEAMNDTEILYQLVEQFITKNN